VQFTTTTPPEEAQTQIVTQDFHPCQRPVTGKEFFNYYLDPRPEQAPEALLDCLEKGMFNNPDNAVWYLFARVAREHPWLVRRYEALFREHIASRVVLLKILQQSGDLETRRFLLDSITNPDFKPMQAELKAAVREWPAAAINPLTQPVASAADLDRLWCEFRATGSTAPVLRIIEVFEGPDRIRGRLENWLNETPPAEPARFLWTRLRKRVCQRLREQASIVCDLDRGEVLTQQDLDCHCTMQNMAVSAERARKVAKVLPFEFETDASYLWFKAAAVWSTASHAREHRIVFRLCETEAARRVGRCRTVLQEIVSFCQAATA
jgi:hypothetical protein